MRGGVDSTFTAKQHAGLNDFIVQQAIRFVTGKNIVRRCRIQSKFRWRQTEREASGQAGRVRAGSGRRHRNSAGDAFMPNIAWSVNQ